MSITLWVIQALLALVFLLVGSLKLFAPMAKLAQRYAWMAQTPPWRVRAIGLAELLGAFGLILPGVTHIAPALTVAAAVGLAIVTVSASIFHLVRQETPRMAPPLILCLLAIVIVYGRFAMAPLS
ncbi:MAG TPA: DoxX family protein [Ktedonobacterales bacterium]